jgi:exodeoxyribonuclease VII small subunit
LSELDLIVRRLEEGKGRLDESIVAYERGALLKRHCVAKLDEARAKVERIVSGPDGSLSAQAAETV